MSQSILSTSKFLSLILRHNPELIGLELDRHGWADIKTLIRAANQRGKHLDLELLWQVVHENDKQRFVISEDGQRIRANQGHSLNVDLALESQVPPELLYHGTVRKFLPLILERGLIPGSRQHVHLSADLRTAESVGKRRGEPVILTIAAAEMYAAGNEFYLSQNGVWLTYHVPRQFIKSLER
ncbi:RNA 2'-phosphotransferase [Planctomicrobium sp. SH661]|uniref:RNA 2'-phosphotransferase n=1 Tax=Planctomicrobium sp. SH661 TaxID=3448124 RepID=UPI003F5C0AE9